MSGKSKRGKNNIGKRCGFPIIVFKKWQNFNCWQEGVIIDETDQSVTVQTTQDPEEFREVLKSKVVIFAPCE